MRSVDRVKEDAALGVDMLLEIGSEEIPAGYILSALEALKGMVQARLKELRLNHGEIHVWGTPRRLAIMVKDLDEVQGDLVREIVGPPIQVAFNDSGEPTTAAEGFARTHGVAVADLKIVETSRGSYVSAQRREEPGLAREVLPQYIPDWIRGIPFPKSMRWRDLELRFARPIHWIAALLGEEVLPCEIEGLRSGRKTRGHRFMNSREVDIPNPHGYRDLCRSLQVIVDPDERREMIREEAQKAAQELSGRIVDDPELLETVVYLVELPVAVAGSFEQQFLSLPRDVLVTVMREHQKFFCMEDENGDLLPHFINIVNIKPRSLDSIREGNERVLKARLSDARFFFEEDTKRLLADRVEDLQGVIFHAKLGTLLDKVKRAQQLAVALAEELAPQSVKKVERAAWLCKADLTTEMVGEFPSLQGVMGREYALKDGEDPDVACALRDYYLPAFSGDRLPSNPVGAVLGIADKLDTILGCFCVGETPTGAGDPFGLRRAALGIIHILQEKGYELPLGYMVNRGLDLLDRWVERPREAVASETLTFFRVRLQNLWASQGRSAETVEAVLAADFENIPDAFRRLNALETFMAKEGFADLAISFKRVLNIVGDALAGPVQETLFQLPEEHELFGTLSEAEIQVTAHLQEGKPLQALEALAGIRNQIDRFFDGVLVNVEDAQLRENRQNMLARLGTLFLRLADFSKISARL